jgi:nitroimidazol reductase NimA-like FMN-containing flavoprotein (pyridoxamine 5'-phosphate oxidase superfamily)
VLDGYFVAHICFARDNDFPVALPMLFGREGDVLYLHGSGSGGLFKRLRGEGKFVNVCVTVTIIDGLVVARSLFNSSCNYRSACVFGKAELVESDEERLKAMRVITDHSLGKERWADSRLPNETELKSTAVLRVEIESASAKTRIGPPDDDKSDVDADEFWAGVIPLNLVRGNPVTHDKCTKSIPDYMYVSLGGE